jgi:nucleotide-binding universal stress UspA family protein
VAPDPSVRITHELVAGEASASELIVLLERFGCDLIVLGSHGHGLLRRFFRGSLTDQVVRHARCPVLVVKAPHDPPPVAEFVAVSAAGNAPAM